MLALLVLAASAASPARLTAQEPLRLIFDTDMGNDVDDAMALAMIHTLETRGVCKLLAVTITKDHPKAGPFVDAINTFYNRGDIADRRRPRRRHAGRGAVSEVGRRRVALSARFARQRRRA